MITVCASSYYHYHICTIISPSQPSCVQVQHAEPGDARHFPNLAPHYQVLLLELLQAFLRDAHHLSIWEKNGRLRGCRRRIGLRAINSGHASAQGHVGQRLPIERSTPPDAFTPASLPTPAPHASRRCFAALRLFRIVHPRQLAKRGMERVWRWWR